MFQIQSRSAILMRHCGVTLVHVIREQADLSTSSTCSPAPSPHLSTENIQSVILSARPEFAVEGTDNFTLQYSILQGVVEQQTWFFNGEEIKTDSHYSVEQTSLVILRPNRRDTGRYAVLLTNPFSSVTADMNVTVLCKIKFLSF